MRCDKMMKRDILSLRPVDTVHWAAQVMRDNDVGFLPVIDEAGKVLGTLTDRDIVLRICADDRGHDTRIADIYTRECVAVRPEDDICCAEELMARHRKSRILVIDELGRLRGV